MRDNRICPSKVHNKPVMRDSRPTLVFQKPGLTEQVRQFSREDLEDFCARASRVHVRTQHGLRCVMAAQPDGTVCLVSMTNLKSMADPTTHKT